MMERVDLINLFRGEGIMKDSKKKPAKDGKMGEMPKKSKGKMPKGKMPC